MLVRARAANHTFAQAPAIHESYVFLRCCFDTKSSVFAEFVTTAYVHVLLLNYGLGAVARLGTRYLSTRNRNNNEHDKTKCLSKSICSQTILAS